MSSIVRRCVVDETMYLVMNISRWFGLTPVRFTKSRDTKFMYISRTFIIYGVIFTVVFGFMQTFQMYLGLKDIFSTDNKIKNTDRTNSGLLTCNFFVTISLTSIGLIYATRKTKNSMYCIESVTKIKNKILGRQEDKVIKWKVVGFILVVLFGTWILNVVDAWRYHTYITSVHWFCELFVTFTLLILMELHFAVIAMYVKSGFQAVNECLRNIISTLDQETSVNYLKPSLLKIPVQTINAAIDLIGTTNQRYPDKLAAKRLRLSQKVRDISQSYVGVCDVLRDFNSSESATLFVQLTILTLHSIITVFNLIKSFHSGGQVVLKPDLVALQCVWLLYHIFKMILLVEPCCRTEQEVAETRILVGKLMCYVTSESDPLLDETEAFYNHILLNDVSYTTFGICTLGRPLISKVIGGVSTILVLLF